MIVVKLRNPEETGSFFGVNTVNYFFVRVKGDYYIPLPSILDVPGLAKDLDDSDFDKFIRAVARQYMRFVSSGLLDSIENVVVQKYGSEDEYRVVVDTVLLKLLGFSDKRVKKLLGPNYNSLVLKAVNLGLAYYLSLTYKWSQFIRMYVSPDDVVERPFNALFKLIKSTNDREYVQKIVTILVRSGVLLKRNFGFLRTPKGRVPYIDDFDIEWERERFEEYVFDGFSESVLRKLPGKISDGASLFQGFGYYHYYGYYAVLVYTVKGVVKLVGSDAPPLMSLSQLVKLVNNFEVVEKEKYILVKNVGWGTVSRRVVLSDGCAGVVKDVVHLKFLELSGVVLVRFGGKVFRLVVGGAEDLLGYKVYSVEYERTRSVVWGLENCKPFVLEGVDSVFL